MKPIVHIQFTEKEFDLIKIAVMNFAEEMNPYPPGIMNDVFNKLDAATVRLADKKEAIKNGYVEGVKA